MYKAKIVFLNERSDGSTMWSHCWVDWDGQSNDELKSILAKYRKEEEKALKKDNMDEQIRYAVVVETVVVETVDVSGNDGSDVMCNKCDCYIHEFEDEEYKQCPYCGSSDWCYAIPAEKIK